MTITMKLINFDTWKQLILYKSIKKENIQDGAKDIPLGQVF